MRIAFLAFGEKARAFRRSLGAKDVMLRLKPKMALPPKPFYSVAELASGLKSGL
jgi:hypothetical protein